MSFEYKKRETSKILISLCAFNGMEHFEADVRSCIQ